MIKHIVWWTLKDSANGCDKAENASIMKAMLEELPAKISEIRAFEVSITIYRADPSCDIVLYSEFNSPADFEVYRDHPDHDAVKEFVANVRDGRAMVDYEV